MDEKEINRILFPSRKNITDRCVGAATDAEVYFVTVCTKGRIQNLAHEMIHTVLRRTWLNGQHWLVYAYVIMPDHIHLIVARASHGSVSLRRWVGWWKRQCAIEIAEPRIVWQKGCWDTRIRNEHMWLQKYKYICDNPVRKGLVRTSSDWPFMGNLCDR